MVVLVGQLGQDNTGVLVHFVAVRGQLINCVPAARVNDYIERPQELHAFLDTPGALDGRQHLRETVPLHVADAFRACAVCDGRPLFGVRDRAEQVGQKVNLTAYLVGFMRNVQRAADNGALHKNTRVYAKTPVGALPQRPSRVNVELLDAPVLEDSRLADLLVLAAPHPSEFLGVATSVVLHFSPQFVRKPRVVIEVHFDHSGIGRRLLAP